MASSGQVTIICVFCGSQSGKNPAHLAAARSLAQSMHAAGAQLVYGGGTVGLMGELARTLVSLSGPSAVHGIIPDALVKYEQAGRPSDAGKGGGSGTSTPTTSSSAAGGTATGKSSAQRPDEAIYGRTTVVKDMHTRKAMMAREVLGGGPGSGFVALPGGYGTLEELMEITTWNQLGIHDKPICVLNVAGYYDGLIDWVRGAVAEGFVSESNRGIISEAKDPEGVLRALGDYRPAEGRFNLDWEATSPVEEKTSFR